MAFTLATSNKRTATTSNTREESEFDGLWLNVGVATSEEEDGDTKFVRLPRGIAVSDLQDHKVYANTNPEWAAEAQLVNSIMDMIRKRGLTLAEGEAMPINLSVQLYRRQEQVEQVAAPADTSDLESQLFT